MNNCLKQQNNRKNIINDFYQECKNYAFDVNIQFYKLRTSLITYKYSKMHMMSSWTMHTMLEKVAKG